MLFLWGTKMTGRLISVALAAVLLLGACENASVLDEFSARPHDVADPAAVIAAADWDKATEIKMTLGADYGVEPTYLSLEINKPYKLVVRNFNWTTQSIAADEFYKTIAIKTVTSGDHSFEQPRLDELLIPSGETREMYFVPTERGVFEIQGRFILYTSLGFVGRIEVE